MRAVIVYESVFGNTREVAEEIAAGIHDVRSDAVVRCVPVADADTEVTRPADLLVVGGPTHMRGMSSGLSRKLAGMPGMAVGAKDEGSLEAHHADTEGPGLRAWFHSLPDAENGTHAAAFDTRGPTEHGKGAAGGIARRLSHHHYDVMAEPEGFVVDGIDGPLHPGDRRRARSWGAALV
ncbi:flavodoxin family protein [Kitasatospora acidiphila]|uniref:flavodoxin family protein n=1 Tax=Kitasatospora acidiphila TaxID=2567942 RepID=UPI003C7920E9